MRIARLSLITCLVVTLAAVGCASDPNKNANDAHEAELKAQREHNQDTAGKRGDQRENVAESRREGIETTAAQSGGGSATKDRVGAEAKLNEAREVYRSKATERLEKLDARTAELKTLIDRAGSKATTKSRDSLRTVETQRTAVTRDIDQLRAVPDDHLAAAKTSVEAQLDTLEGLVKKTAKDVEEFKR